MSLRPLFLILVAQGIGALLVRFAHVPLPDAVIGMLLFFIYLTTSKAKFGTIETTGDTLLRYLPLFFVPASVGVMQYEEILSHYGVALLVTLTLSVLATMLVTIGIARVVRVPHR